MGRYGAKFRANVTALRAGERLCRLHAVDPATRRHVAALLLVIVADLPEIRMVHEITLPVLTPMRKRLMYKSEITRPMRYVVRSSDPSLVTVQTPELDFMELDTRYIEL